MKLISSAISGHFWRLMGRNLTPQRQMAMLFSMRANLEQHGSLNDWFCRAIGAAASAGEEAELRSARRVLEKHACGLSIALASTRLFDVPVRSMLEEWERYSSRRDSSVGINTALDYLTRRYSAVVAQPGLVLRKLGTSGEDGLFEIVRQQDFTKDAYFNCQKNIG